MKLTITIFVHKQKQFNNNTGQYLYRETKQQNEVCRQISERIQKLSYNLRSRTVQHRFWKRIDQADKHGTGHGLIKQSNMELVAILSSRTEIELVT